MSASLPLSDGRRSRRAFDAPVPLDRPAEATPDPFGSTSWIMSIPAAVSADQTLWSRAGSYGRYSVG